ERLSGVMLRPHIGMDTGRVIVEPGSAGYRITGAAVRTAAQLAAHAPANEVWVAPELQRLIAAFFVMQPQPPLAVHDRAQRFVPYRVVRQSGLATRMEAASRLGLTAFTGRDRELAELRTAFERACRGEGALVTV